MITPSGKRWQSGRLRTRFSSFQRERVFLSRLFFDLALKPGSQRTAACPETVHYFRARTSRSRNYCSHLGWPSYWRCDRIRMARIQTGTAEIGGIGDCRYSRIQTDRWRSSCREAHRIRPGKWRTGVFARPKKISPEISKGGTDAVPINHSAMDRASGHDRTNAGLQIR